MEWDPSYMNWQPQCQSWLHHQQINNMMGQREWKPSSVSHSLSITEVKREQQQHAGHSGSANNNGRVASHMSQNSNSLEIRPAELRTDHPNVMPPHHPMYAIPVGQHPTPVGQRWPLPEERHSSNFYPNYYMDHQQHPSPCLHDRKNAVLPQVAESRARWPTRNAESPSFRHQDQMATQFYLPLSTELHNRRDIKPQPIPLNGTRPLTDNSASSSVAHTISPNSEPKAATPILEISDNEQDGNRNSSADGCVVCGDRASGIFYSVRSCQGCKGFFKRVSSNHLSFTCANNYTCKVTRATRTKCPACRFRACIRAGMTREGRRRTPIKTRKSAAQPLASNPQQTEVQLTEKGPHNA